MAKFQFFYFHFFSLLYFITTTHPKTHHNGKNKKTEGPPSCYWKKKKSAVTSFCGFKREQNRRFASARQRDPESRKETQEGEKICKKDKEEVASITEQEEYRRVFVHFP
jgi:hypothetical protein